MWEGETERNWIEITQRPTESPVTTVHTSFFVGLGNFLKVFELKTYGFDLYIIQEGLETKQGSHRGLQLEGCQRCGYWQNQNRYRSIYLKPKSVVFILSKS